MGELNSVIEWLVLARNEKCLPGEEAAFDKAIEILKAHEPETSDVPKPDSDIGCWHDITHNYTLEQVVSALKAQEPRLMTLNDVKNLKHNDVVWLEDYDKEDVIPAIVTPYGAMSDCIDFAISNRSSMVVEYTDYGSRWRCWTDKPHEEQRKEEKWNDD